MDENRAAYCASKAALNHFARCVAKGEARHGVRVNTLSPGIVLDDLFLRHFDDELSKEEK